MSVYMFRTTFSVFITITLILTKSTQANDSSASSQVDISEELKNIIFRRTNRIVNESIQNNDDELPLKISGVNKDVDPIVLDHAEPIPANTEEFLKTQNIGSINHMGNNGIKYTTISTTTTTTTTTTITPDVMYDLNTEEETRPITTVDETSPDYIESNKSDSDEQILRHSSPIDQKINIYRNIDQNEDEDLQSHDFDELQKSDDQSQYVEYKKKLKLRRRRADLRKYLRKKKRLMVQISDLTDNDPRLLVYGYDDETLPRNTRSKHRVNFRGARRFRYKNQDDASENNDPETIPINTEEDIEPHESGEKQEDMSVDTTPETVPVNTEEKSIEVKGDTARPYPTEINSENTEDESIGAYGTNRRKYGEKEDIDDVNSKNLTPHTEDEKHDENANNAWQNGETNLHGTTYNTNPETSLANAEIENIEPSNDKVRRYADEDVMNISVESEYRQKTAKEESFEARDTDWRQNNKDSVHDKTEFINSEPLPLNTEEENLNIARRFAKDVNIQSVKKSTYSIKLCDEPEVSEKVDHVKNTNKIIKNKNSKPQNVESVVRQLGNKKAPTNVDFGDFCLRITKPKCNKNSEHKETSAGIINKKGTSANINEQPDANDKDTTLTARTETPPKKKIIPKITKGFPLKTKRTTKRSKPKPKPIKKGKPKKGRRANDGLNYQNVPNEELLRTDDNVQDEKPDSVASEEQNNDREQEAYSEVKK